MHLGPSINDRGVLGSIGSDGKIEVKVEYPEDQMFTMPRGSVRISWLPHRLELPLQRSRPIYRPRPSVLSVQSICHKISGQTGRRYGLLDAEKVVQRSAR